MKYEDMVTESRKIRAPSITAKEGNTINGKTAETMIGVLKEVDRKTRFSIRALQAIYVLMTLVAMGYLVLDDNHLVRVGIGCIILAFGLVIFTEQLRYRAYNETYFNVPMVEYLQLARDRMQVFTVRTWLTIPTWLFIDAGICFLVYSAADKIDFPMTYILLGLQIPLAVIIVLDFFSAYLIWLKSHKPVVIEIERMLGEIEDCLTPEM